MQKELVGHEMDAGYPLVSKAVRADHPEASAADGEVRIIAIAAAITSSAPRMQERDGSRRSVGVQGGIWKIDRPGEN